MNKTPNQVISGFHRPVCTNCNRELRPYQNGVGVLDLNAAGEPYQLFDADLWKCPGCGLEVVGGFGHSPIAFSGDADFQRHIESYRKSILIRNSG